MGPSLNASSTHHTNTHTQFTLDIPLYTKQDTHKSHKTHTYAPHKHTNHLTVSSYQLHPDRLHYSFILISLNLCFEVISKLQTISKLKLVQRVPLYAFHVYLSIFLLRYQLCSHLPSLHFCHTHVDYIQIFQLFKHQLHASKHFDIYAINIFSLPF